MMMMMMFILETNCADDVSWDEKTSGEQILMLVLIRKFIQIIWNILMLFYFFCVFLNEQWMLH